MFVDSRFLDLWLDCLPEFRGNVPEIPGIVREIRGIALTCPEWFSQDVFMVLLIFNVIVHPWEQKHAHCSFCLGIELQDLKKQQQETVNPAMAGWEIPHQSVSLCISIGEIIEVNGRFRKKCLMNWWTKGYSISQHISKSQVLWLSMAEPSLWEKASSG